MVNEEVPLPTINQESGFWPGGKGSQERLPAAAWSLFCARPCKSSPQGGKGPTAKDEGVWEAPCMQRCLERVEKRMEMGSQEALQDGWSGAGQTDRWLSRKEHLLLLRGPKFSSQDPQQAAGNCF